MTEGMPRALIEAMARGLPAVASGVGGICELLQENNLVRPGDPDMLAELINTVLDDVPRLESMSMRNFKKAMCYKPEILQEQRLSFWKNITRYSRF